MQTQEAPSQQVPHLPPGTTPQDEIEESVQKGVISPQAGEVLTSLQAADLNHSPADVERHKQMMDMVIQNAASAGKRILH